MWLDRPHVLLSVRVAWTPQMWLDRPHVLLSVRVAWTPQMGLMLQNHFAQNFDDMVVSYYYFF